MISKYLYHFYSIYTSSFLQEYPILLLTLCEFFSRGSVLNQVGSFLWMCGAWSNGDVWGFNMGQCEDMTIGAISPSLITLLNLYRHSNPPNSQGSVPGCIWCSFINLSRLKLRFHAITLMLKCLKCSRIVCIFYPLEQILESWLLIRVEDTDMEKK